MESDFNCLPKAGFLDKGRSLTCKRSPSIWMGIDFTKTSQEGWRFSLIDLQQALLLNCNFWQLTSINNKSLVTNDNFSQFTYIIKPTRLKLALFPHKIFIDYHNLFLDTSCFVRQNLNYVWWRWCLDTVYEKSHICCKNESCRNKIFIDSILHYK